MSKKKLLGLSALILISFAMARPQQPSPSQASTPPAGSQTSSPSSQPTKSNAPDTALPPSAQNAPATTVTVNTRLVQLDVVVTDRKGNPVTDLKKEDFTVIEAGRPQQIATFSFQQPKAADSSKDASKPASPPHSLPPGVYGNRNLVVNSSQTALTVVLLDALNTPIADQAYARYEMLQFLKSQHAEQSTAIFALTSRLLLLQDFTSDPTLLRQAIEKKLPQLSHLLTDPDQQIEVPGAANDIVANLDRFEQDQVNIQNQMRVQITMDAMENLATALAGFPGRKNLVWVSAAFPLSAAFDGDVSAYLNQTWMMDEVRRTATLLTNSQVSVYPVDARGLVGSPLASATFTGRTRGGRLMNGQQLGNELNKRSFALSSSHDAMNQIADATGGKAYYNRNDIDHAVALSIADGSTYYTISYYPENRDWNGKFRKVEVKLDRSGIQARYRHGYYATDPLESARMPRSGIQKEISRALGDPLQSTMITLFGSAFKLVPRDKLQSTTPASSPAPATPQGNDKNPKPHLIERQKIAVRFLVEPAGITLEKRADAQHMSLDFVVAAFKGDKVIGQISQTVEGNPKPETLNKLMQQGILFNTSLMVPKGNCRLRLLVHDNLNGRMGTVDIPITDATQTVQE